MSYFIMKKKQIINIIMITESCNLIDEDFIKNYDFHSIYAEFHKYIDT